MKEMIRIILSLGCMLCTAVAQAQTVQKPEETKKSTSQRIELDPPVEVKKADSAPAAKAVAKPTAKKKEAETEGKIDGVSIARPGGTWLGLNAKGGIFCLSFYDAKKKPAVADLQRASARWNSPKFKNQLTDVLNISSDGKALFGTKPVTPPRTFKVFLALLGADGQVVESYAVDYRE